MIDLLQLALSSILISLTSFGGGAQALFYQSFVEHSGWVSSVDLSAALAFAYATPGPAIYSLPTFVGYGLGGILGAVVGALAVIVVPFGGAILATKHLTKLLDNPRAQAVIMGIGVAIIGILIATAVNLFSNTDELPWQFALAAIAFYCSIRYKTNPLLLIAGGLAIGITLG